MERLPGIQEFTGDFPGLKFANAPFRRPIFKKHYTETIVPKIQAYTRDDALVENPDSLVGYNGRDDTGRPVFNADNRFTVKSLKSKKREPQPAIGFREKIAGIDITEPLGIDWKGKSVDHRGTSIYAINSIQGNINQFNDCFNEFMEVISSSDYDGHPIPTTKVHKLIALITKSFTLVDEAIALLDNFADREGSIAWTGRTNGWVQAAEEAYTAAANRIKMLEYMQEFRRESNIQDPITSASIDPEVAQQELELAERLVKHYRELTYPEFFTRLTDDDPAFLIPSYWGE